jgi:molybdopterin molybdotransferase
MIPVAEALNQVISAVRPLPAETVPLNQAHGRVLAEDVSARLSNPPAAVSSMDGYAVRSRDLASPPVVLRRIGESAAGSGFEGTVEDGQTARIFTGAPLPAGADAVVMQEDTEVDGDAVTFQVSVPAGNFIRAEGIDFKAGQVMLPAGRVLSARDVALAAAMNVPWLSVRRQPRVAFFATGDELAMPGEPVGAAGIVSSNSVALDGYIRALGALPLNLGIATDDMESLRARLAGAEGADILVTIGGASVGDYDLVQRALGEKGLSLTFYKVAMRPGKPLIFGNLKGMPVLGLPGNPVSAGVTSILFLKPAIEVMLGTYNPQATQTALLGCDLKENDLRQDYLRAALTVGGDGQHIATPFQQQDSALSALLAQADCLVIRAPHAPPAKAGERVDIVPLREAALTT